MGIHDGHRERLRHSFLERGLEGFSDVQALELLLFFAKARSDTNPTAHALLEKFRNLSGVLNAGYDELLEVDGIGESSAVLIMLVQALVKRAGEKNVRSREQITSPEIAASFLFPKYLYETRELAYLMCLDANKRIIALEKISTGVVNTVDLNSRLIAETALRCHASSVIVSHNHPDGNLTPSRDDIATTVELAKSLNVIGIHLDDHIIVSGDRYCSLCELGYLS